MRWLQRALNRLTPTERITGRPPSGNGASSFHIHLEAPERFSQVSVTLAIVEPPTVDRLYFFALQASFWSTHHHGGAHVGLQWNQRHPGSTAVNWGGYDGHGSILDGSESELPSAPNDRNTRDFAWRPNTPYRFTIGPRTQTGWPAAVTDLSSGVRSEIRELFCEGDQLRKAIVWAEVFADCDHPPVEIRWRDAEVIARDGTAMPIRRGRVTYQSHPDGGCANTTVLADGPWIVQRSASERRTPHNTVLAWD